MRKFSISCRRLLSTARRCAPQSGLEGMLLAAALAAAYSWFNSWVSAGSTCQSPIGFIPALLSAWPLAAAGGELVC